MPASGIPVELHVIENGRRRLRRVGGRPTPMAGPILRCSPPTASTVGVYELTFRAGGYLSTSGAAVSDPPFLGDIVVPVGIADPIGRYHVPLLLSPYGYSVYRGS